MAQRKHKSLTLADVRALGSALIEIADLYPLQYRTERDFCPLVLAYLNGLVPSVRTEVGAAAGRIDFRVGGPNPALLELAVAPRTLSDPRHPKLKFPGHQVTSQLYASQNKTELRKLTAVPQSKARNRYLLLLDLRGAHNFSRLKRGYEPKLPRFRGGAVVRVLYVKGEPAQAKSFPLGGTRRVSLAKGQAKK